MTKHEFKENFEELIFSYLRDNQGKKDFPDRISIDYSINNPNKDSCGEVVFYSKKKDTLLKIKPIDYKDYE